MSTSEFAKYLQVFVEEPYSLKQKKTKQIQRKIHTHPYTAHSDRKVKLSLNGYLRELLRVS